MAKNTQTIRWKLLTNYLSVFAHFVRLTPKGLKSVFKIMLKLTS